MRSIKIQLPRAIGYSNTSGKTLPNRTDRFSLKWHGEWQITVDVLPLKSKGDFRSGIGGDTASRSMPWVQRCCNG
jgi:hypothetical protein